MTLHCIYRPALFLCQADGSLAIMEISNNSLIGQPTWVQPKNPSQAINMILLARNGSPLYSQGTHLHLSWAHNNMLTAEPDSSLHGMGGSEMERADQPLSPVGHHDVERANFGTYSHVPDDALSNRSARGQLSLVTMHYCTNACESCVPIARLLWLTPWFKQQMLSQFPRV